MIAGLIIGFSAGVIACAVALFAFAIWAMRKGVGV